MTAAYRAAEMRAGREPRRENRVLDLNGDLLSVYA